MRYESRPKSILAKRDSRSEVRRTPDQFRERPRPCGRQSYAGSACGRLLPSDRICLVRRRDRSRPRCAIGPVGVPPAALIMGAMESTSCCEMAWGRDARILFARSRQPGAPGGWVILIQTVFVEKAKSRPNSNSALMNEADAHGNGSVFLVLPCLA